jgi:hypothetical protein
MKLKAFYVLKSARCPTHYLAAHDTWSEDWEEAHRFRYKKNAEEKQTWLIRFEIPTVVFRITSSETRA